MRIFRRQPSALRLDAPGLALAVRTDDEPAEPLRSYALTLPVEPDRVTVLLTPGAVGHPRLPDTLPAMLKSALEGTELRIRLATCREPDWPGYPTAGWAERAAVWVRVVTDHTGRKVVWAPRDVAGDPLLPLAGPYVGRADPRDGAGDLPGPPRPNARPYPLRIGVPAWSATAADSNRHDVANALGSELRSGMSVDLVADPDGRIRLLAGRRRIGPLSTPVRFRPHPDEQVPARGDAAAADARESGPGPVADPPPGHATPAGWSFATSPHPGAPATAAGTATGVPAFVVEVEVRAGTVLAGGRPITPSGLARHVRACPGWRQRPVVAVPTGRAPPTAVAGLLYGGLANGLGVPVLAADGTVFTGPTGALVTGGTFHRWRPRRNGEQVRRPEPLGHWFPAPIPYARPASSASVLASTPAPAPAIETPASAASVDVAVLALLDPVWPCPAVSVVEVPVTVPEPAAVRPVPVPERDLGAVDDLQLGVAEGSEPTAGDLPRPRPLRLGDPARAAGERTALRSVLSDQFDKHARFVTRLLAEQPGLRAGHQGYDLLAALTALRAWCAAEHGFVDQTLRDPPDDDATQRALVLAGWAALGLARCPAHLGALVRVGDPPVALVQRYRPGMVLTEPGFVEAHLGRRRHTTATVEYMIWSVTARRMGRIVEELPGAGDALFGPGARFEVLAVETPPPATPGAPAENQPGRVFLRELTGSGRPGGRQTAQRVLDRLRAMATTELVPGDEVTPDSTPGRYRHALGVDSFGQFYPVESTH
ncbi:hypothetical protein KIF24_10445 [Micromonospora sp. Llam7]|uniref:hypothetical protein n=1 Tax=Micromonospora tarapacensis TaxID=2835305 RepID=UPI001C82A6CF|nr:hypothetical protein [Micromonospora tarapacensis]MBX7266404.1 hypothetical protein [Micromonospora tarapacensis]